MWTLISYSNIEVGLKPYKGGYAVGIAENESSERFIVQVDKGIEPFVGAKGDIIEKETVSGKINVFISLEKKDEKKKNKVALVTGGSRGIGRAICLELARAGFDVAFVSRQKNKASQSVISDIEQLGRKVLHIVADVSNMEQINSAVKETLEKLGRIDVLVNNAGIVIDKMLENMTEEQWHTVLSVNLTGVFNCTKCVLPVMKRQGEGRIINISSVVGEIGNIGQANYAAAKSGIIGFTKTVAREHAKDNIIVNALAPGFIETDMTAGIPKGAMEKIIEQVPMGRMGKPEEVAKLVKFLATDAGYITGQVFRINGGLNM